jgi:Ca-activated chloride channel homolog
MWIARSADAIAAVASRTERIGYSDIRKVFMAFLKFSFWSRAIASFAFPFTLAVLFAAPLVAQTPDEVFKSNTALVQLNVGVVDRQGRAITSLSQANFKVYEDGVQRPIVAFEPTNAPFSLVLLLDMSGSTVTFRQQLQQAAMRFLDALAPEDRVAVIQFNGKGPKTLLGFTTNRRDTAYAISNAEGRGETFFYKALDYSIKQLSKEGKRRKGIVVMTDGVDTEVRKTDHEAAAASPDSFEAALAAIKPETSPQLSAVLSEADREAVSIFPLALPSGDAKRLPFPNPVQLAIYKAARARLETLATRTGGRLNEIKGLDQLARLYAEVAANVRALYTIAYQAPSERLHDGRWREIRIEVSYPELIARTKPGYFAR